MITGLDPFAESFLIDVARLQQRIADANRQISSGLRIASPADAPDQISPLLELRASLQHNRQILTDLGLAKSYSDGADSAMASAIQLMDRARTLASQGASSTQTSDSRLILAQEIQSIQEEVVSFSRTGVQGRYIL